MVSITIVTFNSRRYIGPCLESVFRHTGMEFEVVVVDNASTDGTRDVLACYRERIYTIWNHRNEGFAAAQNQAIAASSGDWILALNPDVVLLDGFVRQLLDAGRSESRVGTVCGRLLSIGRDLELLREPLIDSTGIYFTPSMRHFDRGWHEPDDSRYGEPEYVFGASAAAALYRREMIEDISYQGEFFDPNFFTYREDADVAWRAQLMGWQCLYVPFARAYHVRSVVATNRRQASPLIKMHSVKNRFLMRIKNATAGLYKRYWWPMTVRDLCVAGGCLLWEPSSLPAFWWLAKSLPDALRRRRAIMGSRRVADEALLHWFNPGELDGARARAFSPPRRRDAEAAVRD